MSGTWRAHVVCAHPAPCSCVRFSRDGNFLASGSASGQLLIHQYPSFELICGLYVTPPSPLSALPEGRTDVEETLADGPQEHQAQKSAYAGTGGVGFNDVDWSADSKRVVSGHDDGRVRIWDVVNRRCALALEGHTRYVLCVAFSHAGNLMASGSFDETVRLWNVRPTHAEAPRSDRNPTGMLVGQIDAHCDPITSVQFSPDDTMLLTSAVDGMCRLWDVSTRTCLKTLVNPQGNSSICHAQFTPNGAYILQSSWDNSVKLLNLTSGKCTKVYRGHSCDRFLLFCDLLVKRKGSNEEDEVVDVYVVSGSQDGRVFMWELQTKEMRAVMEGHESVVVAVSAHPLDGAIASGSLDCTVRVWSEVKQ